MPRWPPRDRLGLDDDLVAQLQQARISSRSTRPMLAQCLAELRTRVRAALALRERLAFTTGSETLLNGKPDYGQMALVMAWASHCVYRWRGQPWARTSRS
jgi:hypothetical protein